MYLDIEVVIYLIEGAKELVDTVLSYLQGTKTGQDVILISDITRLECRVKPLREKNEMLLKCYDDFFESKEVVKVEISPMVWDLATTIRAQYNYRVPDALHLASAVAYKSNIFLTNDLRLKDFPDIDVKVLSSTAT